MPDHASVSAPKTYQELRSLVFAGFDCDVEVGGMIPRQRFAGSAVEQVQAGSAAFDGGGSRY